ncbi:MAG: ATP-binding protein [Desulfosalsimonadaceae bacterium]
MEKSLVRQRLQYGRELLTDFSSVLQSRPSCISSDEPFPASEFHAAARRPFLLYGCFTAADLPTLTVGNLPQGLSFDPHRANRKVMKNGQSLNVFLGTTWGVFWKQNKYVAISRPMFRRPHSGAATVLLQLDDIYRRLRNTQKLVLLYGLANFFLLLCLAMYRFHRIIIRPINRFIRVTEQLRSSDQFPEYPERPNNELSRLSNAIHQMARRIEADKEQIQASLQSLQTAHNDLKNTQQEMIRAEKLASVGRLSAGIAHEIGNPIGIVLGYLNILKRQPAVFSEEKNADYITRAESEITRINDIIRQLLDFSRASPGRPETISVHDLLRDVGEMLKEQPLMQSVDLQYDLAAEQDRVDADYQQLRQVLINLLINAADSVMLSANAEAGEIRLQTRDVASDSSQALNQRPSIELTVADNGTGIAGEDIDNIFDPFYTTKDPGKGTGLGLSVSYMIIEQFGGTITVSSRLHEGTAMSVYLEISEQSGILSEKR